MYLTAIRSPIYGDHGRPRTDEVRYTDQGISEFNYALTTLDTDALGETVRAARQFNIPTVNIMENRHAGHLPRSYRGLAVDVPNVAVTALKRSEDGKGLIVRAYETDGKTVDATLSGALIPTPCYATFAPYEIKTLYLPDGGAWREVMITEWDM
jgi:alpha-mannosidase